MPGYPAVEYGADGSTMYFGTGGPTSVICPIRPGRVYFSLPATESNVTQAVNTPIHILVDDKSVAQGLECRIVTHSYFGTYNWVGTAVSTPSGTGTRMLTISSYQVHQAGNGVVNLWCSLPVRDSATSMPSRVISYFEP